MSKLLVTVLSLAASARAFMPPSPAKSARVVANNPNRCERRHRRHIAADRSSALGSTSEKAAPSVTGEELELMMTEWDTPLVVDAYATWCGPCLLMSPEFEAAAQELKGKVRFAKLDTDKEPEMAGRLNIMGLPTLLFLDKFEPKEEEEDDAQQARAVLLDRIEGALRKDSILALCDYHFFGGPRPESL